MLRKLSVLALSLSLVVGCASGNGNTNEGPGQPSGEAEAPSEKEIDLNDFVLQETGQTLHYHGLAEYGHNETLQEVKQTDSGRLYIFQGVMNDGTGRTDENGNPFSFQKQIHVTDQEITSSMASEQYKDIQTSVFSEKILLQRPIKVHHSWQEQVEYDEMTYDAVSTIASIEENGDAKVVITVETVVENMEGYPENKYKERVKLEEGKGLISFENNDRHFEPPLTEDGYTFGYGLSVIQ